MHSREKNIYAKEVKKFLIPAFIFIFSFLFFFTFSRQNIVHAACTGLSLNINPIPQNYNGPLSFTSRTGGGTCFNSVSSMVVAFPTSVNQIICPDQGLPGAICSDATLVNATMINFSADFSQSAYANQTGTWNLWVCAKSGNGSPDCNTKYASATFSYGTNQAGNLPKISPTITSQCTLQTRDRASFPITNLTIGQQYEYYFTDECSLGLCNYQGTVSDIGKGTKQCTGPGNLACGGYSVKGTFIATSATMTEDLSNNGSGDTSPGTRTICVDGTNWGQRVQTNCITLTFQTTKPSPPNTCPGVTPPPAPQTACETKYNGTCVVASSQHFNGCPVGTQVRPNDSAGCNVNNPNAVCCESTQCSAGGGSCQYGVKGGKYCCDNNAQCTIPSSASGDPHASGTCQTCSNQGGSCAGSAFCCTQNNLTCDTTTKKCTQCINDGASGCNSTTPCCSGNNTCTNGGKCVSACIEGMSCTGDGDCCAGAKCSNGACAINSNIPAPTFPPVNWCPGGTCNTAVGDISSDPSKFISRLFGIILSLAGIIAVLVIIYSGYILLTSQGTPEKVQSAKETLTAAIVGLVFTIFSLVILQTIGVDILHLPGFGK